MNKLLRLQNIIPSLLITMTACGSIVASPYALAEDNDENSTLKQKLYLDAAAASSAKDYNTAVEKYRAYLKLDPENEDVKGELAAAEKALVNETSKKEEAVAQKKDDEKTPRSTYEKIVKQHNAVFAEADKAINEARILSENGNPKRALALLSEVQSALPETSASEPYRERIALARQRAEIVQDKQTDQETVSEEMTEKAAEMMRSRVLLARRALERARSELGHGQLPEAIKSLDEAKAVLPAAISTRNISKDIDIVRAQVYAEYFFLYVEKRSPAEAEYYMKMVKDLLGDKHKIYLQLVAFYQEWRPTAYAQNPATLNPNFIKTEAEVADLLAKAKALYLYGDYHEALKDYQLVLTYQPDNAEAKSMQIHIREILSNSGAYNREVMKSMMFSAIDEKWNVAKQYAPDRNVIVDQTKPEDPIVKKMSRINIPVALRDATLQRAIETLSELSQTYDPVGKGVDIVLIDPENKNPTINLTMKSQPLSRVLETMLRTIGYTYDVKDGVVEVRKDIGASDLETTEIDISPKVVRKMIGLKAPQAGGGDAFGAGGAEAAEAAPSETGIKNFLLKTGVSWENGRNLAYDEAGNKIIVSQDRKNIDRIRSVILRMNEAETKQVNIETKFIEVNANTLNQVVVNWQMGKDLGGDNEILRAQTSNRSVSDAHVAASSDSYTKITSPDQTVDVTNAAGLVTGTQLVKGLDEKIPQLPPQVTNQPNYGVGTNNIFEGVIGAVGDYDVRLLLNALNGKDGTDLMAAPSLTMLSGIQATIKIVQLLRWPQSYDDMQIQVSSSNNNNNNNNSSYGSSSVAITPGTPQFEEDATEVGIQMQVNPTVNNADNSITLELAPKIVEFEGFVEYGGNAVAISSGTVVTTPAGFYQPVFNVREVTTTVEIYDGATIVIGGLTREEVKTVNDKVPILGDLPLIGSAFRSTGKSVQKKNLLIFVTANLMSRGGGTEFSTFRGTRPGEVYSNSSLFTSAGPVYREIPIKLENTTSEETDAPTQNTNK